MSQAYHPEQKIGSAVKHWVPPQYPKLELLTGSSCRIAPLNIAAHASSLFTANAQDVEGRMWTYLPYGPFSTLDAYSTWLASCNGIDPLFFVILDATNQALGLASYLRIDQNNGVIEIGHLAFSPQLQRTTMATEAIYLLISHAFELGYRRCEWKCNALNIPSCLAAERFGFKYEGTFRQAAIVKGHNRDTAWYSIIDSEWPQLKEAFQRWLAPENFDATGKQRTTLSALNHACNE